MVTVTGSVTEIHLNIESVDLLPSIPSMFSIFLVHIHGTSGNFKLVFIRMSFNHAVHFIF